MRRVSDHLCSTHSSASFAPVAAPAAAAEAAAAPLAARQAVDDDDASYDALEETIDNYTEDESLLLAADLTEEEVDGSTAYASLLDSTGTIVIGTTDDGNFILDDAINAVNSTQFVLQDFVVDQDVYGNLVYFYTDTMTTLGVSRLRIRDIEDIPITAELMTFVPFSKFYSWIS